MGLGSFGDNGELYFEIQLVAVTGESYLVDALFDTGFTDGWLAINTQDLEALGWSLLSAQVQMTTARGNARFDIYEGKVIIDGIEVTIPIHVGDDIPDTIMGSLWLDLMQLLVNKPKGILMLEIIERI
jgi:predicted aspartyl protease